MFEKETTIVLGAGASADFGVPLGAQLFEKIKADAHWIAEDIRHADHPDGTEKKSLLVKLASDASKLEDNRIKEIRAEAKNLCTRTKVFLYNSIDRFMRENPSSAELSKLLISLNLMWSLYTHKPGTPIWTRKKDHLELYTGQQKNWIAAFAAHFRDGLDSPEAIHRHYKKNPLHILSFNYEDIFQQSLQFFLSTGERFEGFKLEPTIRVHNCYGKMPSLPDETENFLELVFENAASLKTIFEAEDPIPNEYERRLFTENASFFLGFSCDKENLRFLGLNSQETKSIYVHDYGGDRKMQNILASYGVITIASGTQNRGKSITDLIEKDGAFEENFLARVRIHQSTSRSARSTSK